MTQYLASLQLVLLQNLFWWFAMCGFLAILLHFFVVTTLADVSIKSRREWGDVTPSQPSPLISGPVSWVVIHHSGANHDCTNSTCSQVVKNIQWYQMSEQHWTDIGYNFLVAPTGHVFEGRGWGVKGAHTVKYNSKSVGICLIGNYQAKSPPEVQLTATQELISKGVDLNKIKPLYKLVGHRQVTSTKCPGDKLQDIIKLWPQFQAQAP